MTASSSVSTLCRYGGIGTSPPAELAAALAWSLGERGETRPELALATGRRRGRELCREHGVGRQPSARAAREQVAILMERLGFAPEPDDAVSRLRLTRCPLLQAAHTNEVIVCDMHQGLVEGVLDVCGAPSGEVRLTPFAEPGACLLVLSDGGDDVAGAAPAPPRAPASSSS